VTTNAEERGKMRYHIENALEVADTGPDVAPPGVIDLLREALDRINQTDLQKSGSINRGETPGREAQP
jgi:hypothetical protein